MKKENKIYGLKSVLAAVVGNGFIFIIKTIGYFMSGSITLMSEAIHSFADTINQLLLYVGIRKSKKGASHVFAYGHGKERFIWALMSACGIFFIGGGINIYHGVMGILHPHDINFSYIIFIIIFISLVVEGYTFYIAYKELKAATEDAEFDHEADPTTTAVLYEDGIAVLGVFIALIMMSLTYITNNTIFDSIGSIFIGVLLGIMAIILIKKNIAFLIEKSVPNDIKNYVILKLEEDPLIEKVVNFKSGVLDVGSYRIACDVEINGNALMKELTKYKMLEDDYENIKDDYNEFLRFCADYADRVPRIIGRRIDAIEKEIMDDIPEIKYMDLEVE